MSYAIPNVLLIVLNSIIISNLELLPVKKNRRFCVGVTIIGQNSWHDWKLLVKIYIT